MRTLPLSTPTAMVLQERTKAGVGVTSLMIDYVHFTAAHLAYAPNDPGPLESQRGRC